MTTTADVFRQTATTTAGAFRSSATVARSRALRYLPATALLLDLVLILAAMGVAIAGRRALPIFDTWADVSGSLTIAAPLIALGWLAVLAVSSAYEQENFGAGTDEYRRVLNATLIAAALTGIGCYLAQYELSRGFFVLLFATGAPMLLGGRRVLRAQLHSARRRGFLQRRVLIAGSRAHVDELAMVLGREDWLGYNVVGAVTPAYDLSETTASGIPVLGDTDDITRSVIRHDADMLFVAGGAIASSEQMRRVFWELEARSVSVVVAPSLSEVSTERIAVRPVGGLPLMHIEPPTWTNAARWGKRTFDFVFALGLVVALSPVMLAIALWIKLHDGGPILFRQARAGLHGETFSCLKFRTMVVDAEARLAELKAAAGVDGMLFKMKDDPRVTRPGRFLRRLSLDELPQLFNVLRSEMSLVGPRPPLPSEVAQYNNDATRRLHVRPGMTGLWQVSGRSDLTWDEAIRLDLYYVDNWSMVADLAILFRTVGAVFASRGAY
ncbi:sugar transferase [Nocardioides sp.]|uniref:sugar transferase n=1 Tax=Nocardioides sp. TaxID=35761 RepID=UPI0035111968